MSLDFTTSAERDEILGDAFSRLHHIIRLTRAFLPREIGEYLLSPIPPFDESLHDGRYFNVNRFDICTPDDISDAEETRDYLRSLYIAAEETRDEEGCVAKNDTNAAEETRDEEGCVAKNDTNAAEEARDTIEPITVDETRDEEARDSVRPLFTIEPITVVETRDEEGCFVKNDTTAAVETRHDGRFFDGNCQARDYIRISTFPIDVKNDATAAVETRHGCVKNDATAAVETCHRCGKKYKVIEIPMVLDDYNFNLSFKVVDNVIYIEAMK